MSHGGKRAGAGRPKGSLGEQTKSIKEAIEYAFYKIGGPKPWLNGHTEESGQFF